MGFSAVAAATVAAGALSAYSSSQAAGKAANAQQAAAAGATDAQLRMYGQAREDLAPYRNYGNFGIQQTSDLLIGPDGNPLTTPLGRGQSVYSDPLRYQTFQPTMEQLEQTPGYQFTLRQGLNAVNNGASARGLAGSGSQQRALADYASGLASTTYQQQLQNYMAQFQTDLSSRMGQSELAFNQGTANDTNLYNRLMGLAGLGQNSAAASGSQAINTGTGIASNLIGAGNAAASGYIGQSNAINQGIGTGINGLSNAYMMNRLFSQPAPDPSIASSAAG